jgi:phosphotransferase system HPr (HPr) family protein
MISKNIVIRKETLNPDFVIGLAKTCSSFNSTITMYAKDQTVNLKSIVNIFGTQLDADTEVEVIFTGNDEEKACEAILALFK